MPSWTQVAIAAPELAELVRRRFEAHGLALLATLRRDGAPRISGIELLFAGDDLWLGMMPDSRKGADLLRDPRFALHNATIDKQVTDGDARLSGNAVSVRDEVEITRFRKAFDAHTGQAPPEGPMWLFRADVTELSTVIPAGDHLDIDWWSAASGLHHVDRY